jgi:putative nucleotidyltransferase with HDIG domain
MLRIAELVASLSLAMDLADGFALEKSLRTCVLTMRLAERVTTDPDELRTTFWTSLLRFVGCTAFAHEEARHYAAGDDIGLRATLALVDFGRPQTFVARAARGIARHATVPTRVAAIGRLLANPRAPALHAAAQCEAGASFARAIDMPEVASALALRGEHWDGRGPRRKASEETLPLALRLSDVADTAELFAWNYGVDSALEELRLRRGGHLDPKLVDAFVREAPELFRGVFATSAWELLLETEPRPHALAGVEAQTQVLSAFSRFADLGSVYTLDHSRRVAELAAAAARELGLDPSAVRLAYDAGLAHDIGRVAVPNGVWEKPTPLSPYERERIRSHSRYTETVLRLSSGLSDLAEVAATTHERGVGSGYHRRLSLDRVPAAARLVGAADVYVALRSARPQRPAFAGSQAPVELLKMVASGELDGRSVDAVLAAAGVQRPRPAPSRQLSERELQVIRLVAIGRTNREIGDLLGISPRTAQKHVMNVYAKVGLESRAGLALFAMEHSLLDD